jgi:peptidoglycan/xylan/chitin deacetylase (PgdA/CDA1 family)
MLGLGFEVEYAAQPNTQIHFDNGIIVTVEDHFFNQYPISKSYLQHASIPKTVKIANKRAIPFLAENDIPILFGNDSWCFEDKHAILGIDIFAAAFFCLTRWEEAVTPTRDIHGRFPAMASHAVECGYLQRPIVNEMAEMLRNLFEYLGEVVPMKTKKFNLFVTHDVDYHFLWLNWYSFIKKVGGDLLKRRDLPSVNFSCRSFFGYKFKHQLDPYDTYDYLMDISERYGLQSHFYFLAGGETKFDNGMERQIDRVAPILARINERGHKIGIHPSYQSATDGIVFEKEVERFRSLSPQALTQGRQHYLRFQVGKTWLFWENNGLQMDSTLGYPEQSGFRCGTCTPFPVFDIFERKQLKLIEVPLTAMDTTYAIYQKSAPIEMEDDLVGLLDTVKKYNGSFTLLWHNSSFHVPDYQVLAPVYERFLALATATP